MMEMVKLPDGVSLCTKVDGADGAPWIILSNSLGASLAMWDGQVDLLTRKYRVLRYDQRGHGQSDAPTDPYTFDLLVGDVIALMDHYGIPKADFMGLSMGGMTGMGLALSHEDRFGKVVVADARSVATEAYKSMWDQRIAAIKSGGVDSIADASLGLWFTDSFRAENPDETAASRAMIAATDPKGYIASCNALSELDYLKDLGAISLPVLYLCGANDKGAPPAEMQEMALATPDGRYVELADAGHVSNINQPKAFNDAIADFLEI
tara:strand:- start:304 stop:1098 length:795 start_codon:yes stop_codon:yes gene_type:complete